MQVSRSPTARWTSAAATAESTPPDSAQMTSPSDPVWRACASTRSRIPCDGRVDEVGRRPGLRDPGDLDHEVAQDVAAARRVDDLGVELDAVQVALGCSQAGVRRRVGLGRRAEAVRQPGDRVAVAHPDRLLALETDEQPVLRGDRHVGRAVLAVVGGHDVAAQLAGHQLRPVADAEDGDPPGPDRRVGPRRIGVVDRVPAAGQDDRPGAASLDLLVWRVVRQELGVDVELADAARDQLGELAAEVEDDDGAGFGGRGAGRPVVTRAVGGRGLERGLEVGLDLGVVGGEDPVPGIRRLAVDGLAPLGRRRGVRAGLLLGRLGLARAELARRRSLPRRPSSRSPRPIGPPLAGC